MEPLTWTLAEMSESLGTRPLLASMTWLGQAGRALAEWWTPPDGSAGFDLLVTPTLAEPPVPLGTFTAPPDNPFSALVRAGAFCPFTPPFNVSGQPAVSLPLHTTADGLPVGVQLVAAYGAEDVLVRVAAQLEEARPWAGRHPAGVAAG